MSKNTNFVLSGGVGVYWGLLIKDLFEIILPIRNS